MSTFGIRFGAMCKPIHEQLGINSTEELNQIQKDTEAVNRLRIRGYIPSSTVEKILPKIVKNVKSYLEDNNIEIKRSE